MAEQAQVQENEEQVDEAALEAALDAGFSGEPEVKGTETPPEAKEKPDTESAPAEEKSEPQLATLTVEELEALHKRLAELDERSTKALGGVDKALGHVGSLKQALDKLREGTPAGQVIEVTDEDVADLKKEFPELADFTKKALQNVFGKAKGVGGAAALDPEQLKKIESTNVEVLQIRQEQMEDLEDAYPKWRDVVGKPDDSSNAYRQWLAKQPQDYQDRLNATNSPRVVQKSLDKFQKDSEAAKAAEQAAADKAAADKKAADEKAAREAEAAKRRERLGRAVTPRGSSAPAGAADDEQSAFDEGFESRK